MGKWRKIAYGIGSLGTALSYQTFNNRIQFLYIDEIKISPTTIGIIWFFYGLWNAINDPLMGFLSDRTRTRWGRRIPYILFGSVPLAIFFGLMWLPPRAASTVVLLAYFVVTVFAFDTLWTLIVLAWTSLMPEQWPDLAERAEVSGWREIFSLIGVILALALSPIVIDQLGWRGMALIYAIITAAAFLLSLLGSREDPNAHTDEPQIGLWEGFRASFANRSFRWFLLVNGAKEFVFLILVAMVPFYAKYVLRLADIPDGMDAATQESLLLGLPLILSIPGMFVWTKLTQRVGAHQAWIYTSYILIPGFLVMMLAPTYLFAVIGACLLALGFPGLLMLYNLVISDVIDEDELIGGTRREGFFFGMNGAVGRLAFVAEAVLIATIPPLTGYNADLAIQPAAAVWGFRILTAGMPILACLIMAYGLSRYPLHGAALTAMREQLFAKKSAPSTKSTV